MRYLLDEQLHESAAASLQALSSSLGDDFVHILQFRTAGTDDSDVPALCTEQECGGLITANVRDFGSKRLYCAALLDAGIHVVVLRPGKIKFVPAQQVALMTKQHGRIQGVSSRPISPSS